MMFKKVTLSLAATFAILAPVAAHAQSEETISVRVNIDDLNLNSAKDQARLNSRINSAAQQICGTSNGRSLGDRQAEIRCRSEVKSAVQSQVDFAIAGSASRQAINTRNNASPKA
ncbi:UrcA family protein [Sphingorhabdus arenilitoris]|uniref:UrcA family protein n=1 Tax=Sphingorhabdus arenilitoris TaxID=1490041 RepID=A0ABV8REL9_9SPHN